jgi:hypothetical protein
MHRKLVRVLLLAATLLGSLVSAAPAAAAPGDPPGYFSETGYRVCNARFYDYFNARGAIRTFGYPVSRCFQLDGFTVQVFQRRVLQLQGDNVNQLNLLDAPFLPYTSFNNARFPAQDAALVASAPAPSSPNYGAAILDFVQQNAPNAVGPAQTGFFNTFRTSVTLQEAFRTGGGNQGLLSGIHLEMWGVPTSRPAADPGNANFVYQRFQRGIMHFDAASGLTQAVLLGDYFKSVLTGENLPADLADAARANPYLRRFAGNEAFQKEAPQAAPGATGQAAAPAPPAAAAPAPATAAPPDLGFRYGLQAHTTHVSGQERGRVFNAVKDIGFSWLKQQIQWKVWEPSAGQIVWGEMDTIAGEAQRAGVTMLFSVVGAPAWAREQGHDNNVVGPPQDPQAFARFLSAVAGRYCGKGVGAIEVWNEQNLHYEWGNRPIDPAAYMNLLKPAYSAIKQACPSMVVVSGALTPTGAGAPLAMDDFVYLDGMYRNGLKDVSDAIGSHPSGYNVPPSLNHTQACEFVRAGRSSFNGPCDVVHHSWSFRSTVDGYAEIMARHGDANKRQWATEFGWAAGGAFDPRYGYANDNTYDEQAAWTVEAYQYMKSSGRVGAAFLWNLNFRVIADKTELAQWGIVTNAWQPLPVYARLKAMGK